MLITFILKTQMNFMRKIDLFGEVLETIRNEYVDEVDQADIMDSAINGAFTIFRSLLCLYES